VGVQQIRWDKKDTAKAKDCAFFYEKRKKSSNIIRVIKSRKLRWAGHLAHIGRGEVGTGFWCRNLRDGDHLEDQSAAGRIIFKWIFEK
jgi:hypothetical protein